MAAALNRLLAYEPHEAPAVAWSFAYFFLLLCSYYLLRPVRDALAVEAGTQALQWLFTATFIAMLALVPLLGWLCQRLPRARLLPAVYAFFALNLPPPLARVFLPADRHRAPRGRRHGRAPPPVRERRPDGQCAHAADPAFRICATQPAARHHRHAGADADPLDRRLPLARRGADPGCPDRVRRHASRRRVRDFEARARDALHRRAAQRALQGEELHRHRGLPRRRRAVRLALRHARGGRSARRRPVDGLDGARLLTPG